MKCLIRLYAIVEKADLDKVNSHIIHRLKEDQHTIDVLDFVQPQDVVQESDNEEELYCLPM